MESIRLTNSPPPDQSPKQGQRSASGDDVNGQQRAESDQSKRNGVMRLDRWLVRRLLAFNGSPPIAVRLWDGSTIASQNGGTPQITISLANRKTLRQLIFDPGLQFGDAYSEGRLKIENGRLIDLLRILGNGIDRVIEFDKSRASRWWPFRKRARHNSLAGSKQNIHHHYDIGNDFYRQWLDEQLLYTCAYFEQPGITLEQAQVAKMDHVCRKIWLRRGETVIEAGCGWGAFALHMARHYGVTVRAYNISHEQVCYARERACRERLDGQVEFLEEDWRNITGQADAFVSIGMLEHGGRENYAQLGSVIRQCLKPGGRGLIHSIGQNQSRPFDRWNEKRIFPGAYPPTLAEMMDIFETNAFSVLDVENIRLHYAETIRHWLQRYEQSAGRVAEMFDEQFVRMWRLYLAGSLVAFESGRLQLFQVLFSPERSNAIPRSRRYQYDFDHTPIRFEQQIEGLENESK